MRCRNSGRLWALSCSLGSAGELLALVAWGSSPSATNAFRLACRKGTCARLELLCDFMHLLNSKVSLGFKAQFKGEACFQDVCDLNGVVHEENWRCMQMHLRLSRRNPYGYHTNCKLT